MAVNTDLGELILRLNPYSNNANADRTLTGPVDIYTSRAPAWPPGRAAPVGTINQRGGQEPDGTTVDVQLEMEGDYPAEWSFKGQPQKVYKTIRLKYRYPVVNAAGDFQYWIEDYLLIGYEGGPG